MTYNVFGGTLSLTQSINPINETGSALHSQTVSSEQKARLVKTGFQNVAENLLSTAGVSSYCNYSTNQHGTVIGHFLIQNVVFTQLTAVSTVNRLTQVTLITYSCFRQVCVCGSAKMTQETKKLMRRVIDGR